MADYRSNQNQDYVVASSNTNDPSTESKLLSESSSANTTNGASPAVPSTVNSNRSTDINETQNSQSVTTNSTTSATAAPTANASGTTADAYKKPLSSTTFASKPDETKATADVYSKNGTPVINSNQVAKTTKSSNTAKPANNKSMLQALQGDIKSATKYMQGVNADIQAVRMQLTIPKISSGIRTLPPGCGDFLTKAINDDIRNLNNIIAQVNGMFAQKIPTADLRCLIGIGNLLSDVSGIASAFKVFDFATNITGIVSLVKSALMIGIMGSFILSLGNNKNDKKTTNKAASKVAKTVCKKSDLRSLADMANLTSQGSLKMTNPSIVRDFIKDFKQQPGTTVNGVNTTSGVTATVKDNYATMMSAFNTIDPNWNKATRAGSGTPVTDLSNVMGGSVDFMNTIRVGIMSTYSAADIAAGNVPNALLLLAGILKNGPTDANSALAQHFPYTYLSGDNSAGKLSKPTATKGDNLASGASSGIGMNLQNPVNNADGSITSRLPVYSADGSTVVNAMI